VDLPVMPPVKPMLAKAIAQIPPPDSVPGGLLYEPKWDGFRCVVFRDGDEVVLGSRNERPLTRYFPEVVEALRANLPDRCVLDGEVVVRIDGRLDFERLQERIHPAESRVQLLAGTTPASYVAFDLLALGDDSYLDRPFGERRAALVEALAPAQDPVFVTRVTDSLTDATRWFELFEGAGLDGLVCKAVAGPYTPDKRTMLKVKHARTADCVLAGWRPYKQPGPDGQEVVGSLLLGLYDDDGVLQSVGVAASFPMARRAALAAELAPLAAGDEHPWAHWRDALAHEGKRLPGAVSRWNAGKDLSFHPLRPERVVEVRYDAMEGNRFRHTTQFARWRPDRDPRSCTYDQLERPVRYDLADVLT
jgi:ATP-dependent DNA ligase